MEMVVSPDTAWHLCAYRKFVRRWLWFIVPFLIFVPILCPKTLSRRFVFVGKYIRLSQCESASVSPRSQRTVSKPPQFTSLQTVFRYCYGLTGQSPHLLHFTPVTLAALTETHGPLTLYNNTSHVLLSPWQAKGSKTQWKDFTTISCIWKN